MSQFIEYSIEKIAAVDFYAQLQSEFPEVSWRQGDSDAMGPYIKGYHPQKLTISIWLGESPYSLTISARNAEGNAEELLRQVDNRMRTFLIKETMNPKLVDLK